MLIFLLSASKPECSLRIGVGMKSDYSSSSTTSCDILSSNTKRSGGSSSSLYITCRFLKWKTKIYVLGTDHYFSGEGGGVGRLKIFLVASNLFCSFMQLQIICLANNLFQYLRLCKQFISKVFSSALPHPQTLGLNNGLSLKLVGRILGALKDQKYLQPALFRSQQYWM